MSAFTTSSSTTSSSSSGTTATAAAGAASGGAGGREVKKELKLDVEWQQHPYDRKRGVIKSRMPVILRDLAPSSLFDIARIWEKEKAEDERRSQEEKAQEEEGDEDDDGQGAAKKKKKKDKKKKEKKMTTKERIRANLAAEQEAQLLNTDIEKLNNIKTRGTSRDLVALLPTMRTAYGRLNTLLEILKQALAARKKPEIFDVYWTILEMPLYQAAKKENDAIKEREKEEDKDKKKKKKKEEKKSSSSSSSDSGRTQRSREAQLVRDFKKILKEAKSLAKEEDIIAFQLTRMSDRLPPLSRFTFGFKLDPWQKRVLHLIDQKQSCIVCAPTSSGKTFLSTYTALTAGENDTILFVVPSEPLVWQVAAMFNKLLNGEVGFCSDRMCYRPSSLRTRVVVGTPTAIETSRAKVRGLIKGELEGKVENGIVEGGFDFSYAIYDEIHAMNDEEGRALQRLIRIVNCNFIALSATIGNGPDLLKWMNSVRAQHLEEIDVIDAFQSSDVFDTPIAEMEVREVSTNADEEEAKKVEEGESKDEANGKVLEVGQGETRVGLETQVGRFINLQRYVWREGRLVRLHPCAALETSTLVRGCFEEKSLAFTPSDAYELWQQFEAHFPEEKIEDLAPHTFFQQFNSTRISLDQAKQWEDALKDRFEQLSEEHPPETEQVLNHFGCDVQEAPIDITSLALTLRDADLMPCLCFHLNAFQCMDYFKRLLRGLEEGQARKYPRYYKDLQNRQQQIQQAQKNEEKYRDQKQAEEEEKDAGEMVGSSVDVTAPHPEFVLSAPVNRLSRVEYDDICEEIVKIDHFEDRDHALLRGLRRGIGLYIEEVTFAAYRRVVQKLAQQNKLAIVISDHSLAYGVNMPFRAVLFCGDLGNELNPLMAQQMSGRAGRRGLDTQGNIIYAGMGMNRIKELMLGQVPAIRGRDPHDPTLPLLPALSNYLEMDACYRAGSQTFLQYQQNVRDEPHFYFQAMKAMQAFGFLDSVGDIPTERMNHKEILELIWTMRNYLPESLCFAAALRMMMQRFVVNKHAEYGESEGPQLEYLSIVSHIADRTPCPSGATPMHEIRYFEKRQDLWTDWEALITQVQNRISTFPEPLRKKMLLPVPPGEPIDSTLFMVIKDPTATLPTLSQERKYDLKNRIWHYGNVLLLLHNAICHHGPFQGLALVMRKSFVRTRYVARELIRGESDTPNMANVDMTKLVEGGVEEAKGAEESKAGEVKV